MGQLGRRTTRNTGAGETNKVGENCGNPCSNPNAPAGGDASTHSKGGKLPACNPDPLIQINCLYEYRVVWDCDFDQMQQRQVTIPYPSYLGGSTWTSPYVIGTLFSNTKPMSASRAWCCVNNTSGMTLGTYNAIPKDRWMKCGTHAYCGKADDVKPLPTYHTSGAKEYWKDDTGCTNWYNYLFRQTYGRIAHNRELGFAYFKEVKHKVPQSQLKNPDGSWNWRCPATPDPKEYPLGADGSPGTAPDINVVKADSGVTDGCPHCYKLTACQLANPVVVNCNGQAANLTNLAPEKIICTTAAKQINVAATPILRYTLSTTQPPSKSWMNTQKYNGGAFTRSNSAGGAFNCYEPQEIPFTEVWDAVSNPAAPVKLPGGTGPGGAPRLIPIQDMNDSFNGIRYWQKMKDCHNCTYDYLVATQRCSDDMIDPILMDCANSAKIAKAVQDGKIFFRRVGSVIDPTSVAFFNAIAGWNDKWGFRSIDGYCWMAHLIRNPTRMHQNMAFWNNGAGSGRKSIYMGYPLYVKKLDWLNMRAPKQFGNPGEGSDSDCMVDGANCPCCHCKRVYPTYKVGSLDCGFKGACCRSVGGFPCDDNVRSANCKNLGDEFFGSAPGNNKICGVNVTCRNGCCCHRAADGTLFKNRELNPALPGSGCKGFGKFYQGDGVACGVINCPDVMGCCCDKTAGGAIGYMTSTTCRTVHNGNFQPLKACPRGGRHLEVPCNAAAKAGTLGCADCRPPRAIKCPAMAVNDKAWHLTFSTWAPTAAQSAWHPAGGARRTISGWADGGVNAFGVGERVNVGGAWRLKKAFQGGTVVEKWFAVPDVRELGMVSAPGGVPAQLISGTYKKKRDIPWPACEAQIATGVGNAFTANEGKGPYKRCGCFLRNAAFFELDFCERAHWNESAAGKGGANHPGIGPNCCGTSRRTTAWGSQQKGCCWCPARKGRYYP